ncbi:MAG: TetR/AcrR family transcriptional regulator [Novosphingobium sp.]|nr:TetR/AcrR family transcriptional regulator [Novosphingobium sp.]
MNENTAVKRTKAPEGPAPETSAKMRIFLAAEALIAERGFEAVSSRDITARAGVNLGAINYNFRSKHDLLLEIFRTRASELNRERQAMLKSALAEAPPSARAILRALVEPPTLWSSDERRTALTYLNRARREGPAEVQEIIRTDVRHLRRFAEALERALPHLPREEILWRLHFALGVLHHNSAADYERLALLSGGQCTPEDREALLARLLAFVSAGFGV